MRLYNCVPIMFMSKLAELLRSPYPIFYQRWKAVVLPSAVIFLILYLLQPFGISEMQYSKFPVLLGYGVVTLLASSSVVYLFPLLFPAYYREERWTLGKNLLNILTTCFMVIIGIWLYTSFLFGVALNISLFLLCSMWVLLLSPFPVVFFLMWNRNLQLTRNLREATEINLHLSKEMSLEDMENRPVEKFSSGRILTFTGGSKEVFDVVAEDFLYAEAEGNYIKVAYRPDREKPVVKKLLRSTVKQAEEAVAVCPFIIRCHRAFLVNVRRVVKVVGNSQGYKLSLEGCEEEIPVSRAYAKKVRTLIENRIKR